MRKKFTKYKGELKQVGLTSCLFLQTQGGLPCLCSLLYLPVPNKETNNNYQEIFKVLQVEMKLK